MKLDQIRSDTGAGLLIRQLAISPEFESIFFMYRMSSVRYRLDYYNKFIVSPSRMITEAMSEALFASACFKPVPANASQDIKFQLWGKIMDIYGDFQDKNHPRAVMTIRLILEKQTPTGFIPVINKIYPASVNLSRLDAKQLVNAWDVCLDHILLDFNKDLPVPCS